MRGVSSSLYEGIGRVGARSDGGNHDAAVADLHRTAVEFQIEKPLIHRHTPAGPAGFEAGLVDEGGVVG